MLYGYFVDFYFGKGSIVAGRKKRSKEDANKKEWAEMVDNLGVEYMANRVSIDESRFLANLQRSQCWAPQEEPAQFKVLTAKPSYLINNSHATLFF